MTTSQSIMIILLALIIIIGFMGTVIADNPGTRTNCATVTLIATTIVFIIAVIALTYMNRCYDEAKGKCPEYEKIDNVYKLK